MNRAVFRHALTHARERAAATLVCLLVCVAVEPLSAQTVRGSVASLGDSGVAVVAAEVSTIPLGARVRTDEKGQFVIVAKQGDSLRVRALGFREQRLLIADVSLTIALVPLPTMLTRVVTTVGQREIRASDSPASVTVLTRADIAAANAVSANQLLRRLPGLQEIASPPAQTSIAIRGLDQSRVLVLLDGEPVSGAMTGNRDIGRLSTLAAERIEVVKGPSSVEFGSEALGGVINLVTAAPSTAFTAVASARTGELGRHESSLEASDTFGPLGIRLNGGWRQSDRVTAINASSTTLDRVYDFRGDTRLRLSDRVTVRTDLALSQQRQRWPVGAGFNGFIDNHTVQGFVAAQAKASGGSFRARLFGQRYAYQFREALGELPIAGSADSLEQRERLVRGLLTYNRAFGAHSVDVGAQWSARGITAPTKIDGDSANDRVTEFFARDAWTIRAVLLTAGVRTTSSTLWGSAVAPSAGLVWQATPAWRWRANVARGFRAPSFKELRYTFINGAAGYQIIGSDSLRPESSWSTSVGGSWSPLNGMTLDIDAYRNALTNLISTRSTGTNAAGLIVYQNVNVERARTEGIELGAQQSFASTDLSVGYDFLRARDLLTGATLDGRATHTGRVAVAQRWNVLRGTQADLSARYISSAPRGTVTQAALLSLDGQLRAGVSRGMELSISATNLLDQRPSGWTAAYQRQITVGLRALFGHR